MASFASEAEFGCGMWLSGVIVFFKKKNPLRILTRIQSILPLFLQRMTQLLASSKTLSLKYTLLSLRRKMHLELLPAKTGVELLFLSNPPIHA